MNSLDRVLTTLSHREPDRVPLFLLLTMHGARELGIGIREYFSDGENVAEGQMRMLAKYGHDCLYPFFYASVETEAWGGEVRYTMDGPPNAGAPLFDSPGKVLRAVPPRVADCPCLQKVLKAERILRERSGGTTPIIGVVMSPFSLPVMQMGFERYLDVMFHQPDVFSRIMEINERFCVEWANAQLEAGAHAISYFDPVSSPTIVSREHYLKTGFLTAQRVIAKIKGPTATHFASGRTLAVINDLPSTGTAIVGVSGLEDIAELKAQCRGRLSLLGNLSGIAMAGWTPGQAEDEVKRAIFLGAAGGGFILSDNHGEIPFQVPDDVLFAISGAVRRWGNYPLDPALCDLPPNADHA